MWRGVTWREGAHMESIVFNLPCYQVPRVIFLVTKQSNTCRYLISVDMSI
jgi:hypothetical protein